MSFNISNITAAPASVPNKDAITFKTLIMVLFLVFVGILGNFQALTKLYGRRNSKNSNYTLLLRCLMANNFIGLTSIFTFSIANYFLSEYYKQWICVGLVIARFFGFSSGCIAMVMSVDRYMASNHPFYYHKHFRGNGNINWNAIKCLSFAAAIICFLPFVGFGVYFNKSENKCQRYREAETIKDRAYAILFFIFGTFICIVIVTCNAFVIRAMLHETTVRNSESNNERSKIKFAKLMAFLSLTFVICWMPQMIAIIFALKSNPLPPTHFFFGVADKLMALNFTLDPYVYVFSRKYGFAFDMEFLKCLGCCRRESAGYTIQVIPLSSSSTDTETKIVSVKQLEK